jgi:hypothetical protein
MNDSNVENPTIEIVSPIGLRENKRARRAARPHGSLVGLRIGLLDNNKPNADKYLDFAGALLSQRYPDVTLVRKRKMSRTEADCLQELAADCDVVINAFAD